MPKVKLQVHLVPISLGESEAHEILRLRTRKFLHLAECGSNLGLVCNEICSRFNKLYPDDEHLRIECVQDDNGCDLDPDYLVDEVFTSGDIIRILTHNTFPPLYDISINSSLVPAGGYLTVHGSANHSVTPYVNKVEQAANGNGSRFDHQSTPLIPTAPVLTADSSIPESSRKRTAEFFDTADPNIPTKQRRSIWSMKASSPNATVNTTRDFIDTSMNSLVLPPPSRSPEQDRIIPQKRQDRTNKNNGHRITSGMLSVPVHTQLETQEAVTRAALKPDETGLEQEETDESTAELEQEENFALDKKSVTSTVQKPVEKANSKISKKVATVTTAEEIEEKGHILSEKNLEEHEEIENHWANKTFQPPSSSSQPQSSPTPNNQNGTTHESSDKTMTQDQIIKIMESPYRANAAHRLIVKDTLEATNKTPNVKLHNTLNKLRIDMTATAIYPSSSTRTSRRLSTSSSTKATRRSSGSQKSSSTSQDNPVIEPSNGESASATVTGNKQSKIETEKSSIVEEKTSTTKVTEDPAATAEEFQPPPKRGRGRPPKVVKSGPVKPPKVTSIPKTSSETSAQAPSTSNSAINEEPHIHPASELPEKQAAPKSPENQATPNSSEKKSTPKSPELSQAIQPTFSGPSSSEPSTKPPIIQLAKASIEAPALVKKTALAKGLAKLEHSSSDSDSDTGSSSGSSSDSDSGSSSNSDSDSSDSSSNSNSDSSASSSSASSNSDSDSGSDSDSSSSSGSGSSSSVAIAKAAKLATKPNTAKIIQKKSISTSIQTMPEPVIASETKKRNSVEALTGIPERKKSFMDVLKKPILSSLTDLAKMGIPDVRDKNSSIPARPSSLLQSKTAANNEDSQSDSDSDSDSNSESDSQSDDSENEKFISKKRKPKRRGLAALLKQKR
ncbi:hypothetical protein PSN45_004922 [Yamadazyma tenuis]|uniref:uncharacterized protein n=1 Tax=Candida tenuis TaxID=2315449 RepID=UPI0027A150F7|nr:hypothetical protein PSN45_004922 [Yamadazyma tenuis]